MYLSIVTSVLLIASIGSHQDRLFPALDHQTIQGKHISNAYFKDQQTIVVHMHLGCPPAMVLLRDLEVLKRQSGESRQVLMITENTKGQIEAFNSTESNPWSDIRNHFGLEPLAFDVIAECDKEKISYVGDDMVIEQQCRMLAKKLKTRSSPTLFVVDERGAIIKRHEGYLMESNPEVLKGML